MGWQLLTSVQRGERPVEQSEGLITRIPNPPLEVLFQKSLACKYSALSALS